MATFARHTETYSEPCQTSKMERISLICTFSLQRITNLIPIKIEDIHTIIKYFLSQWFKYIWNVFKVNIKETKKMPLLVQCALTSFC